jgi:ribosomal protein S18 acetylase RimI-like enzyme
MLRATIPADTPALKRLAADTGFFKAYEIDALEEVLDDYHAAAARDEGHLSFTLESPAGIDGFVYIAPAPMTRGAWHLWWIVVRAAAQGSGLGGQMLRFVEDEIRRCGGRVLFIETSSQPLYEPTWRFYAKHGYERHAVLRGFYAADDDMVVYRRELGPG